MKIWIVTIEELKLLLVLLIFYYCWVFIGLYRKLCRPRESLEISLSCVWVWWWSISHPIFYNVVSCWDTVALYGTQFRTEFGGRACWCPSRVRFRSFMLSFGSFESKLLTVWMLVRRTLVKDLSHSEVLCTPLKHFVHFSKVPFLYIVQKLVHMVCTL